jgi:hypothetical protein
MVDTRGGGEARAVPTPGAGRSSTPTVHSPISLSGRHAGLWCNAAGRVDCPGSLSLVEESTRGPPGSRPSSACRPFRDSAGVRAEILPACRPLAETVQLARLRSRRCVGCSGRPFGTCGRSLVGVSAVAEAARPTPPRSHLRVDRSGTRLGSGGESLSVSTVPGGRSARAAGVRSACRPFAEAARPMPPATISSACRPFGEIRASPSWLSGHLPWPAATAEPALPT